MNQDVEHLRLLSIFHYICAALAALCGCFPIIHLVMGLVLLTRPAMFGSGQNQPPAFAGIFLVLFAGAFILFGWTFSALLGYAGRCLSRRKRYTFCLVMACVACLFTPFGTVLGVFSI